jgi:broad specificity phosphatase PhoE
MKWPKTLTLVRHDTSAYNVLKAQKEVDPLYASFVEAFEEDYRSPKTKELATQIRDKYALGVGGADTPLIDGGGDFAFQVGEELSKGDLPDVIFVSPYKRTLHTLEHMTRAWPALASVKTYQDERVREQENGLGFLYSDWRVFYVFHPEQKELHDLEGPYWYRYPQGESVADVRERGRSFLTTLTRDFAGKNVLVVTHHLNILALRANLERLNEEEFIHLDTKEKPINCGVTIYTGNPNVGENGKLELSSYNKKLYT